MGRQTNSKYEPMTTQAFPLHLTSGFPFAPDLRLSLLTPDLFPLNHLHYNDGQVGGLRVPARRAELLCQLRAHLRWKARQGVITR